MAHWAASLGGHSAFASGMAQSGISNMGGGLSMTTSSYINGIGGPSSWGTNNTIGQVGYTPSWQENNLQNAANDALKSIRKYNEEADLILKK